MLETEFLKLKYHANVESNTDEVDAEEYFNNNFKKIDANAKKSYEKLQLLVKQQSWNTAKGKSIHIQDSAEWEENRLEISGDMEQENLLNIEDSTITSKGITSIAQNGVLNISGTTTANWFDITSGSNKIKVNLKSNIEYVLDINKELSSGIVLVARFYNEGNENVVQSVQLKNGSTRVTFTLSKDIERCYFTTINCTAGEVISINNLKITMFPIEIKTATGVQKIRQFGKNFIPLSTNRTLNGVTLSVNEKGIYTLNGTATNNCFFTIPLKKVLSAGSSKTMSLQILDGTASGNGVFYLAFRVRNSSNIYSNVPDIAELQYKLNSNKYTTKTIINECATAEITVLNGVTLNNVKLTIQLEGETTATSYEPYWEQIHTLNLGTTELCAIKNTNGNVVAKDRKVYRNGKWQWEKKIGKVILNGTEDYVYQNNARFFLKSTYFTNTNRPSSVMEHIPVSNYFEGKTMGQTWSGIEGISNDNNGSLNIACNSIATTVQEFKTWLSTHNLIVYYILENPQYIDCTAEQSAVLDKLHSNFALQKGTNNIIVESSNGVGVNMELTYMQDLQTKLNSLEAMCVSNASQEV